MDTKIDGDSELGLNWPTTHYSTGHSR